MLVVYSSPWDTEARRVVERWAGWNASLLTSRDLSRPGWAHRPDEPWQGTAVVSGRAVAVEEIRGVLVRWPGVMEWELHHIRAGERNYVAAEMTAFLRAWLNALPCRVVNRPSAVSLCGPGWRPEAWVHRAARLGLAVRPVRRRVPAPPGSPGATQSEERRTTPVTVVGACWFGEADPALATGAFRLARSAGVDLLQVHFDGAESTARLVSADPLPPLSSPTVTDALRVHLLAGSGVDRRRVPS